MAIRIINLVDNIGKVNFGIWNAAIATAPYLLKKYGIESSLWFPQSDETPHIPDVKMVALPKLTKSELKRQLTIGQYSPDNTLVVSHGCWQYPTVWANQLKKMGFKWIYVPHGMLEPWSMGQKRWQKSLYFKWREHPLANKADMVRAVGRPESANLSLHFRQIWLNANGIHPQEQVSADKWSMPPVLNYLFMARLHEKKGIVPLVEAWMQSPQFNHGSCHLTIAGPDDGQLPQIQALMNRFPSVNITYAGGVYGKDKSDLLNKCHVYILPSFSEGFPTSVLEAMANQMVTVITDGCNFPEAFECDTAIRTNPSTRELVQTLKWLHRQSIPYLEERAKRSAHWVLENYSNEKIADEQAKLYRTLLVEE